MIINQVWSLSKPSLLKPQNIKNRQAVNKPLYVFCFDDGRSTDYSIAFPIMQSLGIKGTSYLITDKVGTEGYLTWSQINEMKIAGWDFQCHTTNHADLTTLTESELRTNMEGVNSAFVSNGLLAPQHHAYPQGLNNDLVRTILSEYRLTQRKTGIDKKHLNDYTTIHANSLNAVSIDTQNDERLELVKSTINYAVNNRKIMISYCHKIVPEYDGYDYQIMQSYFEEILNHIQNIGVETLTISEMYDRVFVTQ